MLDAFLTIATYKGSGQRVVIDEENSVFCTGNYVDGVWIHSDSKCEDKVAYKTVDMPSKYIAVKVGILTRPGRKSLRDCGGRV